MPQQIIHNIELQRFEARNADTAPAYLSYVHEGTAVVFDHTFVPSELRGRGIAAMLVQTALDEARKQSWKVVPRCSYVAVYMDRHSEYADLIERRDIS